MKPLFAKAQGKACYTVFLNGWSLWCSTKTPQSPQCLIGGSVCSLHTSEVWLVWGLSWIEMIGVLEKMMVKPWLLVVFFLCCNNSKLSEVRQEINFDRFWLFVLSDMWFVCGWYYTNGITKDLDSQSNSSQMFYLGRPVRPETHRWSSAQPGILPRMGAIPATRQYIYVFWF